MTFKQILILAVLGAAVPAGPAVAGETYPEKAVCQVCSQKGEGHGEEKVAAMSTYEEKTYYFCSEGCKEAFDADPAGFLPQVYPRPAANLNAVDLAGEPVDLSQYAGKVLLLDFWATWCKPCVKIMPRFQELQEAYGDVGLEVLGVSIDEDAGKVKRFLEKKPFAYRMAVDDSESPSWAAYSVKAIPTSFLIDRGGNIVARWVGEPERKELEAAVTRALEPGEKSEAR